MRFRKTAAITLVASLLATIIVSSPAAPAAAVGSTYYVDSVAGSDTNVGTVSSAPWKTLTKVNTVTLTAGSRILLKAGSVFANQYLDLTGSGAFGAPIVVDRYGAGARPLIDFGNTSVGNEGFGVRIRNGSHWEVNNLEITSGQHATAMRRNGILVVGEGPGGGDFSQIKIVNNVVRDIFGSDRRSGGINLHARNVSGGGESTWRGVLIQGNTVDNVSDTGIQTMTDALTGAPGWVHQRDAFRNLLIRGNTVTRIHRDGILVRASNRPLVEYNTTDQIGRETDVNASVVNYLPVIGFVAAQWMYFVDRGVFQFNTASNTRKLDGDGQAWDFDYGVYDSVYQYNYSFNNEGGALLVLPDTSGNVFRYNISQNDFDRHRGAISIDPAATGDLAVYNNVFYRSQGQYNPLTVANTKTQVDYRNNIFYNLAGGGYENGPKATYANNTFFGNSSATVTGDPSKSVADPQFALPGGATDLLSAIAAYALGAGSASRDSAAVLPDNGGIDIAGRPLPTTSIDRGAVEGTPAGPSMESSEFASGLGAFTPVSGTWSSGAAVGAALQTDIQAEGIAVAGSNSWTDYSVSSSVAASNANGNAGVIVRYTSPSNFLTARFNHQTQKVELYKKQSGVMTLLGSSAYYAGIGEYVPLRVEVRGPSVDVWVGPDKLVSWTDTINAYPAGAVGLRMGYSRGAANEVLIRH